MFNTSSTNLVVGDKVKLSELGFDHLNKNYWIYNTIANPQVIKILNNPNKALIVTEVVIVDFTQPYFDFLKNDFYRELYPDIKNLIVVDELPDLGFPETYFVLMGQSQQWKIQGLCPRCGDRGEWVSLGLFCKNKHGQFM